MLKAFLVAARLLSSGGVCLALAACASVSGSGPSADDVADGAGPAEAPRYELVDVDSHVVDILRHRGPDSFLAHFGDYRPSVEPRIGIGDTVSVTIWEACFRRLSCPTNSAPAPTARQSPSRWLDATAPSRFPMPAVSPSPGTPAGTCRRSSNMRSPARPSSRKCWSMSPPLGQQ
jgi:hypothetical protein